MPDDLNEEIQVDGAAVLAAAKVLVAWEQLPQTLQATLPTDFQVAMGVLSSAIDEVRAEP
jgi:hypothetical protein